jgi:hypothetical protein
MPTEAFRIADSSDPDDNGGYTGTRISRTFDGQSPYAIASAIYTALDDAGWVPQGGTKASWSLVLPFGVPIADPPSPPLVSLPTVYGGANTCSVDGTAYHFYDPYRVDPAFVVGIEWVAAGLTYVDTVANLAAAIEGKGWVFTGYRHDTTWPYVGWLHMDFEAPAEGLEWNGSLYGGPKTVSGGVTSNWYWGMIGAVGVAGANGNAPAGGGVTLRSSQAPDNWVDVSITLPVSGDPETVFAFNVSADEGSYHARALARNTTLLDPETELPYRFRVWANQFQFFVWLDAPLSVHASKQLMCIFPQVASAHGVDNAAIVGNSFRQYATWTNAAAALNSGFTRMIGTYDYLGLRPGWYCMRFEGLEIRDALGRHVAQTALLAAPPDLAPNDVSGQARLCGIAWDSILVAGVYDLGAKVSFLGSNWECIGRYTGSGSELSFWIIDPGE